MGCWQHRLTLRAGDIARVRWIAIILAYSDTYDAESVGAGDDAHTLSLQLLTSIAPLNFGAIAEPPLNPALVINTQTKFDYEKIRVNPDATIDDNGSGFVGSTDLWDRHPVSAMIRRSIVTIATSGDGGEGLVIIVKNSKFLANQLLKNALKSRLPHGAFFAPTL